MKKVKVVLSLLLCLSILLTGCNFMSSNGTSQDTSWKNVSEKKTLTVGVYSNNYPMTYYENGTFHGYDIDLITEVARRLSLSVEFVSVDVQGAWSALLLNQVDCICSGFVHSATKEELYQLSEPYLSSQYVFVLKNNSKIVGLSGLSGKTLGLHSEGTANAILSQATILRASLEEIVAYKSDFAALDALIAGEIDVAAVSKNSAGHYIKNGSELKFLTDDADNTEIISSENFVIASKRGSLSLITRIEETISTMRRDGILDTLSEKWFSNLSTAS